MGRAVLILIAGFTLLVTSSWLTLNRISGEAQDEVLSRYSAATARNAANSATQRAIAVMDSSYHTWTAGYSAQSFAGATYWTTIANPTRDRWNVSTKAVYNGDTANVKVEMQLPSLDRFAWFSNDERGLNWVTGDLITGPIHTNGFFTMSGTPRFTDEISSTGDTVGTFGHVGTRADTPYVHTAGVQPIIDHPEAERWGAPRIDLVPTRDVTYLQNQAGADHHWFHRTMWIQLGKKGALASSFPVAADSLSVRAGAPSPLLPITTQDWFPAGNPPDSIIPYSHFSTWVIATDDTCDIHVWGRFRGELTLAAGRNLYIEDDIVYSGGTGKPTYAVPAACTDYLGLVARDTVFVAWRGTASAQDASGPNQHSCGINASILAYQTFMAQNYNFPKLPATAAPRDTLFVVGSVVQNARGNLYTSYPSGYTTRIFTYDPRLATHMPPSFPLYDQESILAWIE